MNMKHLQKQNNNEDFHYAKCSTLCFSNINNKNKFVMHCM